MFGLQKYLNRFFEIKWKFPSDMQNDLEDLLYVEFKREDDYFKIDKVLYTYVDVVIGLDEMSFVFTKSVDDLEIKILKI